MSAAADAIARILAHPGFRAACATLAAEHDRTVADIVTLTEIPAPSGDEAARGAAFAAMLAAHGLEDVGTDSVGNVSGLRRGRGNGERIVLCAHMDTVFPAGTDVRVRREGTRLLAPGIGDDTRSLAVMLSMLRAMDAAGLRTRHDLLLVGSVGEETDMRGARHLLRDGARDRIAGFVALDGTVVQRICAAGNGARLYRVTLSGPGGHAYSAFGTVNPAFALGRAIAAFAAQPLAPGTRSTLNIGRLGGGTAGNAIPGEVWADFEMRAGTAPALAALDTAFHALLAQAVAEENAARGRDGATLTARAELREDIPAGTTDPDAHLLRLAYAALAAHGYEVEGAPGITDANAAMSHGIPAIKLSPGGAGGRGHSLDEWIDVEPEAHLRGVSAVLAAILAVAGLEDGG